MNAIYKYPLLTLLAISTLGACSNDDDQNETPPPTTESLYSRLGGAAMVSDPANPGMMIEAGRLGLRSVVDSTIFVIAGDDRLMPYFEVLLAEVGNGELSGFAALSESLTDFFSVATGATSYTYDGLDMVTAHDPALNPRMALPADDEAFDAFIDDVVAGANQNNVPENLIAEIGALIETLREAVVQV